MKEAKLNKKGVRSRKSVGSRSCKSRSSKSSRSSNGSSRSSIKNKAIEGNIKIAELIAESNFTDQKLKMEFEAKTLEIEERLKHKQEPRYWIFWICPHWKVRKMQKEET